MSVHENGRIAQLVEQRIENPRVPGSIPGSATILFCLFNKLKKYLLCPLCGYGAFHSKTLQ